MSPPSDLPGGASDEASRIQVLLGAQDTHETCLVPHGARFHIGLFYKHTRTTKCDTF